MSCDWCGNSATIQTTGRCGCGHEAQRALCDGCGWYLRTGRAVCRDCAGLDAGKPGERAYEPAWGGHRCVVRYVILEPIDRHPQEVT